MVPVQEAQTSPPEDNEYTRLHITPFNEALFPKIVPPSILPNARNVSYHTIQTFPEKDYGFVELPIADAEKIKKKFRGAILKGAKVQINEARPAKRIPEPEGEMEPPKKEKKIKEEKSKKRKRNDETIPGVEIGDRHVKRGWTEPTAMKKEKISKDKKPKKEAVKSKYTTVPECLFKTTLPPNVAGIAKNEPTVEDKKERRKSSKPGKDVVLHEFAKTIKHATFLRSAGPKMEGKPATEYVDGKGWVDEEGSVVEVEVKKPERPFIPKIKKMKKKAELGPIKAADSLGEDEADTTEDDSATSSSGESSAPESSDESEDDKMELENDITSSTPAKGKGNSLAPVSDTSSSGSSSDDESDTTSDSESEEEAETESETNDDEPAKEDTANNPRPTTSDSSKPNPPELSISIPKPANAPINPFDAIYKHPKSAVDETALSNAVPFFTFFGADDNSNDDLEADHEFAVPMTPFTKQDFAHRGQRSAAPTPDTAHPGKKHHTWPDVHDDDSNNLSSPISAKKAKDGEEKERKDGAPISDFTKWFYENRGDTNRAWKKRRKTAAKEARQRDNRKRGTDRA
jgi:hypothetical protein